MHIYVDIHVWERLNRRQRDSPPPWSAWRPGNTSVIKVYMLKRSGLSLGPQGIPRGFRMDPRVSPGVPGCSRVSLEGAQDVLGARWNPKGGLVRHGWGLFACLKTFSSIQNH